MIEIFHIFGCSGRWGGVGIALCSSIFPKPLEPGFVVCVMVFFSLGDRFSCPKEAIFKVSVFFAKFYRSDFYARIFTIFHFFARKTFELVSWPMGSNLNRDFDIRLQIGNSSWKIFCGSQRDTLLLLKRAEVRRFRSRAEARTKS